MTVRHIERRGDRLPASEASVAFFTPAELGELLEYSCSLPTGTTIGKRWKRREPFRDCDLQPGQERTWWLGEYYDCGVPGKVGIRWTRIIVLDGV